MADGLQLGPPATSSSGWCSPYNQTHDKGEEEEEEGESDWILVGATDLCVVLPLFLPARCFYSVFFGKGNQIRRAILSFWCFSKTCVYRIHAYK